MGNGQIDTGRRAAEDLAELASALEGVAGRDTDVEALCDVVRRAVGGDHASIGILRDDTVTLAATTDDPARADRCLREVVRWRCAEGRSATLRVDDLDDLDDLDALNDSDDVDEAGERGLRSDDGPPGGEALGVHSLLAHVQRAGSGEHVVVSACARRASAFGPEHEAMVAVLGALATTSVRTLEHRRRADQLEAALRTSRRIGAALGIVMATEDVDLDEAWRLLRRTSQDSNVRVADLAERVVRHGPYASLDALAHARVLDSSARHW